MSRPCGLKRFSDVALKMSYTWEYSKYHDWRQSWFQNIGEILWKYMIPNYQYEENNVTNPKHLVFSFYESCPIALTTEYLENNSGLSEYTLFWLRMNKVFI